MPKTFYCKICGRVVIEIESGKAKWLPELEIICKTCKYKEAELPPGFEELFGGFRNTKK